MSALGQKRTCAVQNAMSALYPKADMQRTFAVQLGMSALPPKADMCSCNRCPLSANSGHFWVDAVASC